MEDQEHDGGPHLTALVDPVIYGRNLRAARILAGYDRVTDFMEAMLRKTGVHVSDRTAYAIERGEQLPTIDFFMAAILTLHPPGGVEYFLRAMRADMADEYRRVSRG